ncbi:unnamed protein product [Laminaria digitata]
MLDNTWDTAEVVCSLSPHEPLYDRKKACLRASRQHALRLFHLRRDLWSVDVLRFYRCACLTASELDKIEAEHDARRDPGRQQPVTGPEATRGVGDGGGAAGAGGRGEGGAGGGGRGGGGGGGGEGCSCIPFSSGETDGDASRGGTCRKVSALSCSSSPRAASDESGSRSGRGHAAGGAVAPERGSEDGAGTSTTRAVFPGKASSAENELAALTEVVMQLLEARDAFPTTLQNDEAQT